MCTKEGAKEIRPAEFTVCLRVLSPWPSQTKAHVARTTERGQLCGGQL